MSGRYGTLLVLLACALLSSSVAHAQHGGTPLLYKPGVRAVPRTTAFSPQRSVSVFPDTVRVLALMVQFQQDTDTQTTGDGTFLLSASSSTTIDPAPHDSAYFAHKLLFLKNYFRKSSGDNLIVMGDVWGEPVTLSKQMSAYSPPKSGSNDKPLADLVVESWQAADTLMPAIPFSQYDAFVIFHAGVGRDIDLVGLLGFDPAPNDIPSLYVGLDYLRTHLGNPTYEGVPVQGGAFFITHSMVLPETESRTIQGGGRSDSLVIGMNGLLVSSFGSHIGLPDLFDTQTGNTAIGQFGLMDVASIFSFNGLFPPEPSAWEKIFLGWVEPIVINGAQQTLTLPAVSATANDTIYKIPISDSEYFLLENRNRDHLRNGQTVTLVQGEDTVTKHFSRDTIGFVTTNINGLSGSLIDVEDFDWSIPGSITDDVATEGGGILIWHIDEAVINQKIASNEINADPSRRGVAVEEADGSLDIGEFYGLFDPGLGSEFGSPFDCWYGQNPIPIYRNIFDRGTFPNTNSNTGARTGITIKNFSARSPRMTTVVEFGDTQVQLLAPFSRSLGAAPMATHPTVAGDGIFVGNGSAVYAFQTNGLSKTTDPTGLFSATGGQGGIVLLSEFPGFNLIAGVQDSTVYFWDARDVDIDGVYDTVITTVVPLGQAITTTPMSTLFKVPNDIVVVGGEQGAVWQVFTNGDTLNEPQPSQSAIQVMAQIPQSGAPPYTAFFYTSGGMLYGSNAEFQLGSPDQQWLLCSIVSVFGDSGEISLIAGLQGGTRVVSIDRNLTNVIFDVQLDVGAISDFSAGDLDLDGNIDIVVNAGTHLYALNRRGHAFDGYPVASPEETFTGTPLLGDIDGDGSIDVICLTSNGSIVAYDNEGQMKSGFPLQVIARNGGVALFQTASGNVGIVAVSTNGEMRAWELDAEYTSNRIQWYQTRGNAFHTNYGRPVPGSPQPKSTEFFPKSFVYNWPNPVYGNTTQIRYFVSENADVTIKIFDLVGLKIAELKSRAVGGIDNEIQWDVSGIQSGVYLAHVEANSGNKTESAIIKIAVIK